jgi:hypothetical protein
MARTATCRTLNTTTTAERTAPVVHPCDVGHTDADAIRAAAHTSVSVMDAATVAAELRNAERRAERLDLIGDKRFSQAELRSMFDLIADPDNWKNPIDAWINPAFLEATNRAAIHFAGSPLTVCGNDPATGRLRVRGVGYYMAIGA